VDITSVTKPDRHPGGITAAAFGANVFTEIMEATMARGALLWLLGFQSRLLFLLLGDKRYVRRKGGKFTKSQDVGRSLVVDRRKLEASCD
jgi:hypothetical protein